jgi:putative sigma-54 modulation protein
MGDLPALREWQAVAATPPARMIFGRASGFVWRLRRVQVSITTRHGHLSEASQEKIRAKAEKLGRFFDRLMSIEVIVDLKDSQRPQVDFKVSAEHKHDFVAREQAETLPGALDACIQKIEQQLRKYKERVQERSRNPDARRPDQPAEVVPGGEDEGSDLAEE